MIFMKRRAVCFGAALAINMQAQSAGCDDEPRVLRFW